MWHDPYYLCATYLIDQLCYDLARIDATKVDFFFDNQGKLGKRFKVVYDAVLKPVSMSLFPFMGDVLHKDKREFLPLQCADMQAGWVRRSRSTIQVWTSADQYLSQIDQRHYPIKRKFLDYINRFGREHADEIAAMWTEYMRLLE